MLVTKNSINNGMDIQKRFDVKIVGGKNDLEEHLLINCDELLVPFADISCSFAGLVLALVCTTMVLAILENLEVLIIFIFVPDQK